MEYTQEQLDKKYSSLSQDLKEAIDSVEIGNLVAEIGDKNGLLLDQSAELMNQTALVMLGIITPRKFSNNLVDLLNIEQKVANVISGEINDKIFNKIRSSLQKIQTEAEQEIEKKVEQNTSTVSYTTPTPPITDLTPIEKAGRFTIEKPPVGMGSSPQYKDKLNREAILKDIEDIENIKKPEISIVDHLLEKPVQSSEKVEIKVETKAETKRIDPYREQI